MRLIASREESARLPFKAVDRNAMPLFLNVWRFWVKRRWLLQRRPQPAIIGGCEGLAGGIVQNDGLHE
jgi:hypothetical protein